MSELDDMIGESELAPGEMAAQIKTELDTKRAKEINEKYYKA